MRNFLIGLIVGLLFTVVGTQQIGPEDVDYPRFSMLTTVVDDSASPTGFYPVLLLDATSDVPHNYVHVANFDAQCLTGGKNCKYPVKVYRAN